MHNYFPDTTCSTLLQDIIYALLLNIFTHQDQVSALTSENLTFLEAKLVSNSQMIFTVSLWRS